MKLVTYGYQGETYVGVLSGENVIPVSAAGLPYQTMNDLVRMMTPEEKKALERVAREGSSQAVPFADTVKMSPIPRPLQDVVCLGINYAAHAEEAARFHGEAFGLERPVAIYFAK
ncbi:MAG: fumarylacetoacetase, partial [Lachnospiraceae bacterium]|nr:fumarylacetoacetase [Lachnospiraceae bacterium]